MPKLEPGSKMHKALINKFVLGVHQYREWTAEDLRRFDGVDRFLTDYSEAESAWSQYKAGKGLYPNQSVDEFMVPESEGAVGSET
ncbi:hypothetical protein CLAFUW4_11933 [Fulvia fulva]|uniref:Uncharacterized protein n=1 Tax=Passalora fulva TaxID=5499 RepID=A0A9Q8PE36_PASFU|nr:uncharacterized protein CLAFUR5_10976 [Fulvia fulva]KAK4618102.1 hypothetical protein CLAFUR4_11938 [Fulvia fulva]KAK4619024.1 hypothetical protein CLAFUR0_11949 [Fulvia fulva]UJO20773.1 hypothetical protein CLAFUR5_10976 [Fulvia fulva]WPV17977.1 hypothetical protein CLAFUW4_11933 [Fulvia fulva]WPV33394.1 hypothetical protein CLAFUW7_11940 [Fulvia fulva]